MAAFCGVLTVAAQDLIIKADASKVEAKVTEITPESVRYKRFSNPDGPTYVLPVSEISYIQYANGEKEYFRAAASIPATPLTPALPAEEPATVSAAPAAAEAPAASPVGGVKYVVKEYEIGEFYNQNGIKGVVCMLSDDRQHGLVISLDEIYLHWSEFRKPDLRVIGTDNRSDGSVNMEKVAAYIAENNLSWDDFPAFKWCREKGEGWYLPSIDELLNIGHNYSGGTRVQSSRQARNRFNNALKNNGGKRMDRLVYYFPRPRRTRSRPLRRIWVSNLPMSSKFPSITISWCARYTNSDPPGRLVKHKGHPIGCPLYLRLALKILISSLRRIP